MLSDLSKSLVTMVRITEYLVRKKSEHNELMITTLEELSLHQEDIDKIEHIQNWCPDLKILLLQSNLISKIENLYKFKKLEYLNLSLNNIERIENLEQLESLNKLDLTLNFIGELTSVESLASNYNLRELILTGNPCTDYPGYRDYVIKLLPMLDFLDCNGIKISDRTLAARNFEKNYQTIIQCQTEYTIKRDEQRIRVQEQRKHLENEIKYLSQEDRTKKFWETKSENCPETRFDIAMEQRKSRNVDEKSKVIIKNPPKLFAPCGRPYNLNQAKLKFSLLDEVDRYELDLQVYKFFDTSLIDVDLQPKYVRVTLKGKIFQLALNDEVQITNATSKRSQITGHLLIVMYKLNSDQITLETGKDKLNDLSSQNKNTNNLKGTVNYKNIVKIIGKQLSSSSTSQSIDQSEIPPLV